MSATLHFRCWGAYKSDWWGCYSVEQALRLGEEKWQSRPHKNGWISLYVTHNNKVIKDWLED